MGSSLGHTFTYACNLLASSGFIEVTFVAYKWLAADLVIPSVS